MGKELQEPDKEIAETNSDRVSHYGLRVGDVVVEIKNDRCNVTGKVVKLHESDNNSVYIRPLMGSKDLVRSIAENCQMILKVEEMH